MITWVNPSANGGTIDAFKIKLLNRTSNLYVEVPLLCDGSSALVTKVCSIPIQSFINSLGYSSGQSIKAIA